MAKFFILISFLFIFSYFSSADDTIRVAIYNDNGCWNESVVAFENFLDWKKVEHSRINSQDIINGHLTNDVYKILFIPGGFADSYYTSLREIGINKIRKFVANGGAYFGICAGAYFASDTVVWEDNIIDAKLSLFKGTAVGSIKSIAPWDKYALTTININKLNPINLYSMNKYSTLYYGGPAFYPSKDADIDTLATWKSYNNAPAIINFNYGKGRVVLSGAHPEIEENNFRDGNDFASELNDSDSEWPLLWYIVDWLAQKNISQIPTSVYDETFSVKCYPNPAKDYIIFRVGVDSWDITLFDIYGNIFFRDKFQSNISRIDLTKLPSDFYFYKINTNKGMIFGKFTIVK